MSSEMIQIGHGNNKPPNLVAGRFERWQGLMKKWMRSHDFQAWCVIERGNFEVDATIRDDLSKWGQNEWKCMEANFKAKMYLNNTMCEQDADKVGNLETAKEMWAAIQQMHMGSSDLKEDHQMNARREFFNF